MHIYIVTYLRSVVIRVQKTLSTCNTREFRQPPQKPPQKSTTAYTHHYTKKKKTFLAPVDTFFYDDFSQFNIIIYGTQKIIIIITCRHIISMITFKPVSTYTQDVVHFPRRIYVRIVQRTHRISLAFYDYKQTKATARISC